MSKVTTEYPDDFWIAAMVDRWGIGVFDLLNKPGRVILRVWSIQNEIDRIRRENNKP